MKFFWFFNRASYANERTLDGETLHIGGLRVVVWLALVSLGAFGAWAHWAVIDQITRAPGAVIPSSKTQLIQSLDGGTIKDLLVSEGDAVAAGQVLVRFEKTRFEASFLEAKAKQAALLATVARLSAEVIGGPLNFPSSLSAYPEFKANQTQLYIKRQSALNEEIASIQDQLRLTQEELRITEPLLKTGDVSKTEVLRLQRQVSELRSQITNKRNKYFQDAQAELNKAQEDLAGVEQTMAQRRDQLELTDLRAPLKGIVKNVRITTVGGVIRPGDEVMQIVPVEEDLLIQAKVSPSDIAFLKIGQDVRVKIEAYDYTIYGDLPGKLEYLSADTLSEDLRQGELPYYRARIRTLGRKFSGRPKEHLEILPGMTATVEVQTGRRTVLQYLLKPVIKTFGDSLGER